MQYHGRPTSIILSMINDWRYYFKPLPILWLDYNLKYEPHPEIHRELKIIFLVKSLFT